MKDKILFWVIFTLIIFVCFIFPVFVMTNISFGEEINTDKTYEQCERETFDRIYTEINKELDKIKNTCTRI